jgi:hypothetical protein
MNRSLQFVVSRRPVPVRIKGNYLGCYVIESLECGHEITVYPQADPLIARRRNCPECMNPAKKAKKGRLGTVRAS